MKLRNLFIAVCAGILALTACEEEKPLFGISVDPASIVLEQAGGTATVTVKSAQAWEAKVPADVTWLDFTQVKGEGGETTITVSAEANPGKDRNVVIRIEGGFAYCNLSIAQAGGVAAGDGLTAETAFSASEANAWIKANLEDGASTTEKYFIKGKVHKIKTTFEASGTFGNALFYISDDGQASDADFYAYQVYYLGNRKWTSGDKEIEVGDEVIIYGPVTLYGSTCETVGKGAAYIYSLNGEVGEEVTPEDPNSVQKITCAEFIEKADPNTTYRLVGEVTSSVNTTYCSFDMNDGTATVVVWTVNNKDEWKDKVKKGGTVTVRGKYLKYEQNGTVKHEMVDAYIEDFQEGEDPGTTTGQPSGDGSVNNPFNVAAALDAVKNLTWTSNTDFQKVGPYYVKGKVATMTQNFDASGEYGNASFTIKDDGADAVFTCFRILYFNGEKYQTGQAPVPAVGDEVVIYSELMNYHGDTPETVSNSGYLYSVNGQTSGSAPTPVIKNFKASFTDGKLVMSWDATSGAAYYSWVLKTESGTQAAHGSTPETSVENEIGYSYANAQAQYPDGVVWDVEKVEYGKYTVTLTAFDANNGELVTSSPVSLQYTDPNSSEGSSVTIDLTNATTWTAETDATYKAGFTATVSGVKVGFYQHSSTSTAVTPDQYSARVYKSSVFVVWAPEGKTLKKITFKANDYSNGKYCVDLTVLEGGEGTIAADVPNLTIGPWTGSASKVVFQAAAAQARLESVEVVFE